MHGEKNTVANDSWRQMEEPRRAAGGGDSWHGNGGGGVSGQTRNLPTEATESAGFGTPQGLKLTEK